MMRFSRNLSRWVFLAMVGALIFSLAAAPFHLAVAEGLDIEPQVREAIQRYVAGYYSISPKEVEVTLEGKVTHLGRGTLQIQVQEARQGVLLGRSTYLLNIINPQGRKTTLQWVSAEVEIVRSIVVATETLRRSVPISPGQVKLHRVPIRPPLEAYITDPQRVIGMRPTRLILKGTPIRAGYVEPSPMVHRGDRVRLVVELGGLRVTALGKLKEDGFLGQQVAVINLDSRKTVYGRVVDEDTVRVLVGE